MKKRILAAGIDVILFTFLTTCVSYLVLSLNLTGGSYFAYQLIITISFALFVSKDSIDGRSPGKRIFRLQVLQNVSNLPISPFKAAIRNLFWVIWPVEALLLLGKSQTRIGDHATESHVSQDTGIRKPNYAKLIISFLVAFLCMFGLFQAIKPASSEKAAASYLTNPTYNKKISDEITRFYVDSLGRYLTPEAKVYQDSTGKIYITMNFKLKDDFFSVPEAFQLLNQKHLELLSTKLTKGRYKGKALFEYSEFGKYEARETQID